MSKKMQSLQHALNSTNAPHKVKPDHGVTPIQVKEKIIKEVSKKSNREGQELVSAWLNADFKKSLRLVQVRKTGKVYLDELLAEALNDLFLKYDVPTVRHE